MQFKKYITSIFKRKYENMTLYEAKHERLLDCLLIPDHRRLCRVKNMLAMYLKYHKAGLTPTTPLTSTAISPVNMSIGRKSLTNLRSQMIFLQGKSVFYIFLPSTPPY